MNVHEHILLWNQAFIKIIDIRHTTMVQKEQLRNYRFPASTFLYTVRGSAQVWLDHNVHLVKRFDILHGGKGLCLDIAAEEEFEFYMILYKATLSLPYRQETSPFMKGSTPFQYQYAFTPSYPLSLFTIVEQMSNEWQRSNDLEKLHVKTLFYQFVYELSQQLHAQGIEPIKPDLVAQAIRYIDENYYQPITLDSLAQNWGCSAGYLSKLFKEKMNTSPIHYLGEVRVDKAIKLLLQTDATLQEIAENVGYLDGHTLSRSFKRYKGVSPARFKTEWKNRNQGEDLPLFRRKFAILPKKFERYIGNEIENHYQYKGEVDLNMYRNMRISAMTVFLCLSLLLGACSSASNTSGGSQTPTNNNVETQANSGNSNVGQDVSSQAKTRIVSTIKGDVEIPAEPQRVASDQYMGQLLKLGIIPVGVREGMLKEAWIEKAGISPDILANIEDLGSFPMNAEKLIELEPDLIIGSIEKNIEQYEKIGTTVFVPYWEGLSTAGPIEKFRRISEIFGKQQVAETWITEYEQKVADARQEIAGIIKEGETVSVVQIGSKALFVLSATGGNYGSATIYQMLQLPPTEQALNMKEGFENISLEVLPEYLGDHVFVYVNSKEDATEIFKSAIWKAAPAVAKGQVYMYGEFDDEFVMEDPYSMELQLETIVKVLKDNQK
ncbi:helix-turn-helix domain-containing protein [Paenibacillus anaericanus]|uniref:Helix-turn-helix domain-containing protein n=1 Tax=Paenibacillus anaericanus TaxID=170367 RepID=A0A433Y5A5_9BACL|nr:AraC family transcriptional regulator [Paenibacillus anaericanus]RUT43746.1 helix-turn-helix domain-containing protein [Paenibacillus anaericanus]